MHDRAERGIVTTDELPSIEGIEFKAATSRDGERLVVKLEGIADLRVQPQLEELLTAVDDAARVTRAPEVTVDLRKLEFMNSSCFKAFVSWIGRLQELDTALQYRIHFLSEPRMLWQRRSLHALSCFAIDLISIETS